MKRAITLIILLVLCASTLFAQAPDKFNYQTVVRNAGNAVVADAMVGVRVSILQGSASGEVVYVETHSAVTNSNGLLTVEIGGGKVQQGVFEDIDWAGGPYFLRTETDPNGGSIYTVTETQPLQSVPYALYAKEAANGFSGDYNDLKNKPEIPQNVGELANDAGYITLSDIPNPSKGGGAADFDDAGVLNTDSCGEIDLCELANRLARLQAILQPAVTTGAVSDITETTAICGGTVTANGYSAVTVRGVCWGVEPNPTVNGSHTSDGNGIGAFTSVISGLEQNTTYYVRAYATNSVETAYGEEVTFTTAMQPHNPTPADLEGNAPPCPNAATVTDYDGNVYNTVQIGTQCWMRENLRTTTYADGTPILDGNDATSNTESYYYDNSSSDIPLAKRGYLYNWAAAMHGAVSSNATPSSVQGICPAGWHLPSDGEYTQLIDYVGGVADYQCGGSSSNIAKALASTVGWNTSTNNCAVGNTSSANNATGFSAVPTGYFRGSFNYVGNYAFFWSSTENESNNRNAYTRLLGHQAAVVGRNGSGKDYGRPVRCLCDTLLPGGDTPTPQDTVPSYIQNYYKNAKNKKGYALRVAMRNIIRDYTAVSYNGLWNAFYTTDVRPDNGKVWDIYSDRPGSTAAYYFTFGSDQCGNYSSEGDCYNREHTVPKSWFGGSSAPMYTDLFHLYPTDGYVNSKRGNLPIGKVTNATWTSTNGSKVGTSNISGYSGQVFEPIDSFKGDFARIYLYMAVCYMDENLGVETQSNFSGGDLKPWAKQLLLQWDAMDPVSQKEIDRNNAVYQLQHNRNPFVDYPELVGMIFGSDTNTVFTPAFHPALTRTNGGEVQSPTRRVRESQSSTNQLDANSVGTAGRKRRVER